MPGVRAGVRLLIDTIFFRMDLIDRIARKIEKVAGVRPRYPEPAY